MAKAKAKVRVRLIFADGGAFHHEEIEIPAASAAAYDRLVDCLREDSHVLKGLHVDVDRLCVAYLVTDGA